MKYDGWINKSPKNGPSKKDEEEIRTSIQSAIKDLKYDHEKGDLGYLNLPHQNLDGLIAFNKGMSDSIDTILVLGIGGSSLGPLSVYDAWSKEGQTRQLLFSENIDPNSYLRLVKSLNFSSTMICVTTKSGSTIETMSKFWHLYDAYVHEFGSRAKEYFVAVTDPEKGPLRSMIDELGISSFPVPQNVGGRFSVMTPVGLLPLILAGYPIAEFLEGGQNVVKSLTPGSALEEACLDHYWLHQQGFESTVMMPYIDALSSFSAWFCQLWGESLAKENNKAGQAKGVSLTPLRALGTVDQHSQLQLYVEGKKDKYVVFIEQATENAPQDRVPDRRGFPESLSHLLGKSFSEILDAEARGTRAALIRAGVPITRWVVEDSSPLRVGELMMIYMVITSVMGSLLDINPYDQPGVEFGKRVAHGCLGRLDCAAESELAEGMKAKFIAL